METLFQDLRYGIRTLSKTPGFTAIAIITLAVGIGANSAIFSVVNAVLLRPLPFNEPDRIVQVSRSSQQWGLDHVPTASLNVAEWRVRSQSFEGLAVHTYWSPDLAGGREPEQLRGALVSTDLFELLRVHPVIGRSFTADEGQPGRDQVVMLSAELWERQFGSDPDILGQTLRLDDASYTIVGIAPRNIRIPGETDLRFPGRGAGLSRIDIWRPSTAMAAPTINSGWSRVLGRLKPGVTLEQARREMEVVNAGLTQEYPKANDGWRVDIESLNEAVIGNAKSTLFVLLGVVGFVLLIGCANVSNLLLSRGARRQKEFALRSALGASRGRLSRQLLTESLILSISGGAAGLLLALWGVDVLIKMVPRGTIPRLGEVGVDPRLLAFTFLVSLLSGTVFGLVPALRASKPDLVEMLKEGGRSATEGFGRVSLRNMLVMGEVALTLVLLAGAGLMIKTFMRLQQVELGFQQKNTLTANIWLRDRKYAKAGQQVDFFDTALDSLSKIPGVEATAAASVGPLGGFDWLASFSIEGKPAFAAEDGARTYIASITPDYFRVLGTPQVEGRSLNSGDRDGASPVAVINQTMARRFWPGESPIGRRIRLEQETGLWEIVGVVGDVKQLGVEQPAGPSIFMSHWQRPSLSMTLVLRTAVDPNGFIPAIRDHLWAIDKDIPLQGIHTLDETQSEAVARPRFHAQLIGLFAAVALVLASVGIYGVMAYSTAQRTREIGIRMALGAGRQDVLRMVLGNGMVPVLIGAAVGLAGALALTRVIESLLFGVTATDPATFGTISALLIGVALAACYLPARRAARVDPMVALRSE